MKIYVIFTGGTIGSRSESGIISSGQAPYALIEKYISDNSDRELPEFETLEPYRILSENLSAQNLSALARTIAMVLEKGDADGIIVTHGTDTIQYSAAMLSLVFPIIRIPVMLVSAAYVLSDIRTNGHDNFAGAVRYIEERKAPGVFVSYRNITEAAVRYHRGAHMLMPQTYSSDMTSIDFPEEVYTSLGKLYDKWNLDLPEIDPAHFSLTDNTEAIVMLRAYPGMSYPSLIGKKAVILEGYHSGTLCTNGEKIRQFTSEATKRNIPVFLTGLNTQGAVYETVNEYEKLGILPLPGELPIALYCRLWIKISL